jgi:hypothetical protein
VFYPLCVCVCVCVCCKYYNYLMLTTCLVTQIQFVCHILSCDDATYVVSSDCHHLHVVNETSNVAKHKTSINLYSDQGWF